jgi:hypothetical protein
MEPIVQSDIFGADSSKLTSMAFHEKEYFDGHMVKPSWCFDVRTAYLAPDFSNSFTHSLALKNSSLS